MNYQFPFINHIEQVLPAIANRPEFIVAEKDGYKVVNYVVMEEDTFPPVQTAGGSAKMREEASLQKSILRECRGLIFDLDGKLINRRYHKFFNANERNETLINNIDFSKPHHILEKLDGSMVSPCRVNGVVRWMTKMGITDTSMEAEVFVATRPNYVELFEYAEKHGYTPIFEWTSLKNRIVIDYSVDDLVLTAYRNNNDGLYLEYDKMVAIANQFKVSVVKAYSYDVNNIIDIVREQEDTEGVVVRFADGHMIKVKSDWYVRIHKVKDMIMSERKVTNLIVNNGIDDIIPILPPEDINPVLVFKDAMFVEINQLTKHIVDTINWIKDTFDSKKEFALSGTQLVSSFDKDFVFRYFDVDVDEKEIFNNLIEYIKKYSMTNQSYAKYVREHVLRKTVYKPKGFE